MRKQASIAAEQHDVPFGNSAAIGSLDNQRIPGPDRRQHAPPHDLQSQSSRRTQDIAGQITFEGVRLVHRLWRRRHEALGRATHELCVLLTFPHDKAVVTNTCSKRKDGFSYGFLFSGERGLSDDVSVIVIGTLSVSIYFNTDCEACMAQPPNPPDVVQVWLLCVEK